MKIAAFDIQHVINQIKCASPPSNKDMHKLLNNLSILLEKNTIKKKSPLEPEFNSSVEKLNEAFIDLCFLRKEIVKQFSQEYFDVLNKALVQLKKNKEHVNVEKEETMDLIQWDLKTMNDTSNAMPVVFSKLQKARSIIEDALQKSENKCNDIEGTVEAFFSDV